MLGAGWLWMYLGAFLMLLEIVSPGFVIFFFGLSASTVGLMRFAFQDSFTVTWQLASFSFLCIIYLAVLRRLLRKLFSGFVSQKGEDFNDSMSGRTGVATEDIVPPLTGRVEVGDASWTAVSDVPVAAGAAVVVISSDSLTLKVRPAVAEAGPAK